jgi:hypothetical protein
MLRPAVKCQIFDPLSHNDYGLHTCWDIPRGREPDSNSRNLQAILRAQTAQLHPSIPSPPPTKSTHLPRVSLSTPQLQASSFTSLALSLSQRLNTPLPPAKWPFQPRRSRQKVVAHCTTDHFASEGPVSAATDYWQGSCELVIAA